MSLRGVIFFCFLSFISCVELCDLQAWSGEFLFALFSLLFSYSLQFPLSPFLTFSSNLVTISLFPLFLSFLFLAQKSQKSRPHPPCFLTPSTLSFCLPGFLFFLVLFCFLIPNHLVPASFFSKIIIYHIISYPPFFPPFLSTT